MASFRNVLIFICAVEILAISGKEYRINGLQYSCYQPKEPGPCKQGLPRYYFSQKKQKCIPFTYGGCSGNHNNFDSKEDCETACLTRKTTGKSGDICKLPKKSGRCSENQTRFYYSSESKECLPFTYGGCKGNQNNFETKDICESACQSNA